MSGHPDLELAGAAVAGVGASDQLLKGLHANRRHDKRSADSHFAKAAIGAAVAIVALEMLRRDEESEGHTKNPDHKDSHNHSHSHKNPGEGLDDETSIPGHERRLMEEIAGAYSLGQEILGNKKHHLFHVISEALGSIAALRDVRDYSGPKE